MRALSQQFSCTLCGNVTCLIEEEHQERTESYCRQCESKTVHTKDTSRGR